MIDPHVHAIARPVLAAGILLSLAIHSCSSATPATKPSAAFASGPSRTADELVPLAVGNAWTYELRAGGGPLTSDTIRIIGRDGPWFLDDHKGRMRFDSSGLRDTDRYLLRNPVELGKSWSSVEQMAVQRFEITAVDAAVQTRAGLFEKCVVVKNSEPLPEGGNFVTEWTYAPGTGLISLRTRTVSPTGKEQEQLRLSLSKFERAP